MAAFSSLNGMAGHNSIATDTPIVLGLKRWALAAVAACAAEAATCPIDTTRIRMQLHGELGSSTRAPGMVATARHILATEGVAAMYGGLPAAAIRQAVYGGIGVGLYAPVRALLTGDADSKVAPVWKRMAAGMITGGVGQAIAMPTDVVRVRLVADGKLKAVGREPRYKGTIDAFARIPREEGWFAFFRGIGPSVQRAAIINGCGIASYDHTKHAVIKALGTDEGPAAKVVGSLVSGLISALVSTPFDVVRTRIMAARDPHLYSGEGCACMTMQESRCNRSPGHSYESFVCNRHIPDFRPSRLRYQDCPCRGCIGFVQR